MPCRLPSTKWSSAESYDGEFTTLDQDPRINVKQKKIENLGREHGSTLGGLSVTYFGVLIEQVVG